MKNPIVLMTKRCLLTLTATGRIHLHSQPKDSQSLNVLKEDKIKIGNQHIRYITVGHGPHKLVCIPASAGTIWTDFKPQIEGFDREKFTLLTFDLPGFGQSTPPQKTYPLNFHEADAHLIHEFLKVLGLKKYSILGWCYGSIVSMIYSATYPENVTKLVITGASSHILPKELDGFRALLDISTWSSNVKQPRIDVYGKELLVKHWHDLVSATERRYKEAHGDYCAGLLEHIKCPTFILQGANDPLIDESHAMYLKEHIKDSRLHIYPEGHHNVHLRFPEDFNKRVQEFLLE